MNPGPNFWEELFKQYQKPEPDPIGKLSQWWKWRNKPASEGGGQQYWEPYFPGFGIIAGVKSPIAPWSRLVKGEEMHKAGYPADKIWKRTRTQRFPWDETPRWEVPDEGVSLTNKALDALYTPPSGRKDVMMNLFDAVNAPQWRKAYPELENITLTTKHPDILQGRGSFNEQALNINLRQMVPLHSSMGGATQYYDPMFTLPHEVQHVIQMIEGLPRGYSPLWPSSFAKTFNTADEARNFANFVDNYSLPNLKFSSQLEKNWLSDKPQVLITANKTADQIYPVAAGELEANAAGRRLMSNEYNESPLMTIKKILEFDKRKLQDVIAHPNWMSIFR